MPPTGLLAPTSVVWASGPRDLQALGVSIIVVGVIGLVLAVAMLAVATRRRRDRSHH